MEREGCLPRLWFGQLGTGLSSPEAGNSDGVCGGGRDVSSIWKMLNKMLLRHPGKISWVPLTSPESGQQF